MAQLERMINCHFFVVIIMKRCAAILNAMANTKRLEGLQHLLEREHNVTELA